MDDLSALREVVGQLSALAENLRLSREPQTRAVLLRRFRLLLDQADQLIEASLRSRGSLQVRGNPCSIKWLHGGRAARGTRPHIVLFKGPPSRFVK